MRAGLLTIGATVLFPAIALSGMKYLAWANYGTDLASDDFWDRCRSSANWIGTPPGRYESVVWNKTADDGSCREIRGYCIVTEQEDGTIIADTLQEHQLSFPSDAPMTCTYLGWLLSEQSPWKRVN